MSFLRNIRCKPQTNASIFGNTANVLFPLFLSSGPVKFYQELLSSRLWARAAVKGFYFNLHFSPYITFSSFRGVETGDPLIHSFSVAPFCLSHNILMSPSPHTEQQHLMTTKCLKCSFNCCYMHSLRIRKAGFKASRTKKSAAVVGAVLPKVSDSHRIVSVWLQDVTEPVTHWFIWWFLYSRNGSWFPFRKCVQGLWSHLLMSHIRYRSVFITTSVNK